MSKTYESYSEEDRFALALIVGAIARVAKVARTFTVQHVRAELERSSPRPTDAQVRRLMAAAFCVARRKERGICTKSTAYVPTGDPDRISRSARLVWTSLLG